MSTTDSTRTGHRKLDLPDFGGFRYHVPQALVIVWLFKAVALDREDVLRNITEAGSTHLPENKDRPVGTVAWLRSFEPTNQDVGDMTFAPSILIDRDLLEKDKCIVCHGLSRSTTQYGLPIMEFAAVRLTEAYDLVTKAEWNKSWVSDNLLLSAKLEFPCSLTSLQTVAPQIDDLPKYDQEVAIFVVVELTPEQRSQLFEMLDSESAGAVFIDLLNTSSDLDDVDFLMEFFLARKWFVGDFAVIDAQTVEELEEINENKRDTQRNDEGDQQEIYPSFLLATSLQINHRGTDGQSVGLDEVGYAVGRRKMVDEDEYSYWCVNVFKGMGLRSYIGDEGWERYYWSCWLNEKGRVDVEVKSEADIRY